MVPQPVSVAKLVCLFLVGTAASKGNTTKFLRGAAKEAGYEYIASSTRFGPATGACGSIEFQEKFLDYYVVAAAQSMMTPYIDDDGKERTCGVENCTGNCEFGPGSCVSGQCDRSGCECDQKGDCWCGRGTAPKEGTETASMGCFTCAKARFLEALPWSPDSCSPDPTAFVGDEIKLLVIDACPYGANAQWCPKSPGDVNQCGMQNHIDFAGPPEGINNNYIVFTPEPCSDEVYQQIDVQAHNGCTRQQ